MKVSVMQVIAFDGSGVVMKVSVMQVIISVSQLIGSVMGLSTTRFQESLAIVNNYANSDKSIQVRLVDYPPPTPHPLPTLPPVSPNIVMLFCICTLFLCVCC